MPSKAANKGKGKAAAVMPVKPGPGRGRALGKGTGKGKAASKVAAAAPEVDQEDDNEDEEEEEELLDNEEADEAEGASDDEGSDADDTVDEAGMAKLMELLGDVDPEELGFDDDGSELELEVEGDEAEDGEEASQEEDQEDGEDLDALSGSDAEDDEAAEDEQLDAAEVARAERASRAVAAKKQEGILDRILAKIKLDVPFFETQTLVCPEPLDIPDAANDLQRELQFYKQSLWAAQHAYKLFKRASVPFTRPNDYYAEMLKTDEHMEKIRQKLLDEQAGIKASDNAKRQRELKKFGKQVQVNKLREREKSKRDLDDKVKAFKKKRKNNPGADGNDDFEIDLDDSRPNKRAKAGGDAGGSRGGRGGARGGRGDSRGGARGGARGTGKTRDQRNSKFGQPTTGRRPKENDRESTDMFGGGGRGRGGARGGRGGSRGGLRGGRGGGRGGGASKPRLGKSRRS